MGLEVGKKYIITILINGKFLTYEAIILEIDDTFVSFLDKNGSKWNYNKTLLSSFKEAE